MEAAVPPAPAAPLRTETGFGEIPGVGHQGGSSLAVSKYSKNQDAAWLFAQWATSFDTQVYITTLGGGTGPTRASVYDDKRVKANDRVGAGTTRHLDVVRETIANHIGSDGCDSQEGGRYRRRLIAPTVLAMHQLSRSWCIALHGHHND